MEDFYEILVFNHLLSKLFEPETTPAIELQLNEITRQVVWECSQRTRVPRSSTSHRRARRRRGATQEGGRESRVETL